MDLFRSIEKASTGVYKQKGSKFLSFAWPVDSESAIQQHLTDLRKEYHDARHHCYAWRLGAEKDRYRANDDREPSGSAGLPILGQIRSRDLSNVMVVVVRYFGGTLLGVGGLIQAYRTAAAYALDNNKIIECKVYEQILLSFPYTAMNPVMRLCRDHQANFLQQDFGQSCQIKLSVWKRDSQALYESFLKIPDVRASLEKE